MSKNSTFLLRIIILNISLCMLGYILIETGYRLFIKTSITNQIVNIHTIKQSKLANDRSLFDKNLGYRYKKNLEYVDNTRKYPISFRTNSHGHISDKNYDEIKQPNQYRIGVIGDSFTANVTNTIRWPDLLERKLNDSLHWKKLSGGKETQVINFGLDGIGAVQFGPVYKHEASKFDLDLIIINMIRSDVLRRFYFRGELIDEELMREKIQEELNKIDWFKIYPEVLAKLIGKYIDLKSIYTFNKIYVALGRFYDDDLTAAIESVASVKVIVNEFPNTLILIHPAYGELLGTPQLQFQNSFNLFKKMLKKNVYYMKNYLPEVKDKEIYNSWYNVPYDYHNSDYGLKVYSESVHKFLIEKSEELIF